MPRQWLGQKRLDKISITVPGLISSLYKTDICYYKEAAQTRSFWLRCGSDESDLTLLQRASDVHGTQTSMSTPRCSPRFSMLNLAVTRCTLNLMLQGCPDYDSGLAWLHEFDWMLHFREIAISGTWDAVFVNLEVKLRVDLYLREHMCATYSNSSGHVLEDFWVLVTATNFLAWRVPESFWIKIRSWRNSSHIAPGSDR